MVTTTKINSLAVPLRMLLGGLLVMFISGAGMTAIGQQTSTHHVSSSGNALWHILLVLHLISLLAVVIGTVIILIKAFTTEKSLKIRAIAGTLSVIFGIISGSLVLHKIHSSIFLFCMALAFLFIGFAYGPIARSKNIRMH
jgi:hypothetical protein